MGNTECQPCRYSKNQNLTLLIIAHSNLPIIHHTPPLINSPPDVDCLMIIHIEHSDNPSDTEILQIQEGIFQTHLVPLDNVEEVWISTGLLEHWQQCVFGLD